MLRVPLSGPMANWYSTGIELEVAVGGRVFKSSYSAIENQTATFTWDGRNVFGTLLQGAQPVRVQVHDMYPAWYQNSAAFGVTGDGTPVFLGNPSNNPPREPAKQTRSWNGTIELWDALPQGFGGWTLNVHHTYDVTGRMVRLGDGTNRTLSDLPNIIQTVAGNGTVGSAGNGGPALSAALSGPLSVAVGADGSVYVTDHPGCVRKVTRAGIISVFAGVCGNSGFAGDGGAATQALFAQPQDLAFGPDGSLFIADGMNHRVRRVTPSGTISTVAGSGTACR